MTQKVDNIDLYRALLDIQKQALELLEKDKVCISLSLDNIVVTSSPTPMPT